MNLENPYLIGACGLDCGGCEIRRLPFDEEAAEAVLQWYRREGWLGPEEGIRQALERGLVCEGCRGDRELHWSPDCWILECCVEKRGLKYCSECGKFPCARLLDWADGGEAYGEALERLQEMHSSNISRGDSW